MGTLHPKAAEVLQAVGIETSTVIEGVSTGDTQYWYKNALKYVLDGGSGDVRHFMEKHQEEEQSDGRTVAAILQANRIGMAMRNWTRAKSNFHMNKRALSGTRMYVREPLADMYTWLSATGLTPEDLGIDANELAEVSTSQD